MILYSDCGDKTKNPWTGCRGLAKVRIPYFSEADGSTLLIGNGIAYRQTLGLVCTDVFVIGSASGVVCTVPINRKVAAER